MTTKTIKKFKINGKDVVYQNASNTEPGLMDTSLYRATSSIINDRTGEVSISADRIIYNSSTYSTVDNVSKELNEVENVLKGVDKTLKSEVGNSLTSVLMTEYNVIANNADVNATIDYMIAITSDNFVYTLNSSYNTYVFDVKANDEITIVSKDITAVSGTVTSQKLWTFYSSVGIIASQSTQTSTVASGSITVVAPVDGWVAINVTSEESSVSMGTTAKTATKSGYVVENSNAISNYSYKIDVTNFPAAVYNSDFSCYIHSVSKGDAFCIKAPKNTNSTYKTFAFYAVSGNKGVIKSSSSSINAYDYEDIEATENGILIVNLPRGGELLKGHTLKNRVNNLAEKYEYFYDLEETIKNLPDGQAVSLKVAEHTNQLDELSATVSENSENIAIIDSSVQIIDAAITVSDDDNHLFALSDNNENILMSVDKSGDVYIPGNINSDGKLTVETLSAVKDFVIEGDIDIYGVISSSVGEYSIISRDVGDDIKFGVIDSSSQIMVQVKNDNTTVLSKLDVNETILSKLDVNKTINFTDNAGNYSFGLKDNDEFLHAVVDSSNELVFGIRSTGTIYANGITEGAREEINHLHNDLDTLDAEVKIANNRAVDWSNDKSIKLDIPSVPAKIEIIGDIPTSKYYQTSGKLKYSDCYGNSFTKPIMWNTQGNISAGFDKKNFGIDLYNNLEDNDTFEVTFGDWVPQDSFHLKAYISDFWKIRSLGVYRHLEQLNQSRDMYNRYPYQAYLDGTKNQSTNEVLSGGTGVLDGDTTCGDLGTGALCHPDGFPVMLYINDTPWGLYCLNLKKAKENYHIIKNDDNGNQLCFGDYMNQVFERYENSHWNILTNSFKPENNTSIEQWDATKNYAVGDVVYDTETIDFKVNGKTSSVTICRSFQCNAVCGPIYKDVYHNSTRPSQINWRSLEIRNPKKTITKEVTYATDGTPTYSFAYYDYDAPMNGEKEYTHELIKSSDLTSAEAEALGFKKKEYTRSINTRTNIETYSYVLPIIKGDITMTNLLDWGYISTFEEDKVYNVGDVVVYNDNMYEFKTIHNAGAWNASEVMSSNGATKIYQCKKDIFDEHHDLDFNYDFFLVYNDTNYYDSITHNTIYTMYDGKHLVANIYDTDISLGMSSTYTNGFPAVSSGLLTSEFCYYLWLYHSDEIKERWRKYRNEGIINEDSLESVVWGIVNQIGKKAYNDELNIWPDQPSYRKPVYWYMPAGSIKVVDGQHVYDESVNVPLTMANIASNFSATANYGVGALVIYDSKLYKFNTAHSAGEWVEDEVDETTVEEQIGWVSTRTYYAGERVNYTYTVDKKTYSHYFVCQVACTNIKPSDSYTSGSPSSGGVYDSPKRVIEWWKKRLSYMDTLMDYDFDAEHAPEEQNDALDAIKYVTNDEWAFAVVDVSSYVLFGVKTDGTLYSGGSITIDSLNGETATIDVDKLNNL